MKRLTADMVVISAGTAGLPAAVTAAQGGASVIVFEKLGRIGGTGNVGGQIMGINSGPQRRKGIKITSQEIFNAHMNYVHWRADARLVKAVYDESGKTIDWLEELGIPFIVLDEMGGYPITHRAEMQPSECMKSLANKARELGAQIMLKTPVKKILKEGNRVTGVLAEDTSSGEEIQVTAKAVLIATGGFGDNPEMIKQYTGFEWNKDMYSFRIPGVTGDGIRMAWEAGGARSEMLMQLMFSLPSPYHGPFGTSFDLSAFCQVSNLMVNLLGERFVNEEMIKDTTFGGNAIARQKDRCSFMIFDDDARKFYEETHVDIPKFGKKPMTESQLKKMIKKQSELLEELKEFELQMVVAEELKTKEVTDLEGIVRKALSKGYKHLFTAESLEDLCAQTGIDLPGLQKTITEYNGFCEKGYDDVFGKDPKNLLPVKKPKFYACRYFPSAYGTLGGITINYKAEVLNKEGKPIPGLYAAGTDAAAIYGDSYTRFLYGNTQGFCYNTGRIAGRNMLEYVKSLSA